MLKVCVIIGTRPEAIKMAPVILYLKQFCLTSNKIQVTVCVTGQHRQMLDQVLNLFNLTPDFDLDIMRDGQDLTDITSRVLIELRDLFKTYKPNVILVHGDTTTAFASTLAAYYQKIAVAHVEAGLRTNNIYSPWPEEINRRLISSIAKIHYAPTNQARLNLIREGVDESKIVVTGNTVVDSLLKVSKMIDDNQDISQKLFQQFSFLSSEKKIILVTGHRRENFGKGFENICLAIKELSLRDDIIIVYPVHLNPNVSNPVHMYLGNILNVFLIEPLEYLQFVYLMKKSYLILTDSGGIQEEAPSLGKPVLVMRDNTERPEGIEAGTIRLVGSNKDTIVHEVEKLLNNHSEYLQMKSSINPYGTGTSAQKIVKSILNLIWD